VQFRKQRKVERKEKQLQAGSRLSKICYPLINPRRVAFLGSQKQKLELLTEIVFGLLNSWINLAKDEVISCLPNCPAHQNDYFHEEGDSEMILETLEALERIQIWINMNAQPIPALQSKKAGEEQVCQGIFYVTLAQDAVIIMQCHVLSL